MQNPWKMRMTTGAIVSLIALLVSVTPVAAQEGGNNTSGTDTGSSTQQATTDDGSNGSTNQQAGGTNQQQQPDGTGAATDPCANQGNSQANPTSASTDQSGNDDGQSGDDNGNNDNGNNADMTSGTDAGSGNMNNGGNTNTNQGQTQNIGAGAAQTPCPGTNRETAGPNFAEAVQIAPGTTHWYRFRYVYDEDVDDEPGQAVVSLKMNPVGCASFDVTTSGRLNFPFNEEGDPIGPVGRGTPAPTLDGTTPGTLLWVGSGEFSETHFVIVRTRSSEPCTYTLSITGSPVVF